MEKGVTINEAKWTRRKREPQKWRNYIRAPYKAGRKKYPEVKHLYKTQNHVGEELIRKFFSIAFVVVAYSMLKYTVYNDALLSSI